MADMRLICEALGFDPTNHHNAAKCPYCRADEKDGSRLVSITVGGSTHTRTADDWLALARADLGIAGVGGKTE